MLCIVIIVLMLVCWQGCQDLLQQICVVVYMYLGVVSMLCCYCFKVCLAGRSGPFQTICWDIVLLLLCCYCIVIVMLRYCVVLLLLCCCVLLCCYCYVEISCMYACYCYVVFAMLNTYVWQGGQNLCLRNVCVLICVCVLYVYVCVLYVECFVVSFQFMYARATGICSTNICCRTHVHSLFCILMCIVLFCIWMLMYTHVHKFMLCILMCSYVWGTRSLFLAGRSGSAASDAWS